MIRRTISDITVHEVLQYKQESKPGESITVTSRLSNQHIKLMKMLIEQAKDLNINLKLSNIYEAVLWKLSNLKIEVDVKKFIVLIDKNKKRVLDELLKGKIKSNEFEDFIFSNYNGPMHKDELENKPYEPVQLTVYLDTKALDKLKEYEVKFNSSRSVIFRNVIDHIINEPINDVDAEYLKRKIREDIKIYLSIADIEGKYDLFHYFDEVKHEDDV